MRPLRLELEGFTVFRQPVTVDLDGADLFALTGPTGSGKTSLIDAVTFALYGAVPRLGDRRAVAPVVSQNLSEARVRLDFSVGEDRYSAVRIVRTTRSGGATTREARLELAPDAAADAEGGAATVVAGSADEVTAAVTDLLGLTYEHFTTCVSLPQGQFARFLHDKPRDRQDLLVRLLGLGLYDQVASAARQRATLARGEAENLQGQLTQLSGATDEGLAEARRRVDELSTLAGKVTAARDELDGLAERATAAATAAGDHQAHIELLDALAAPEGAGELAASLTAAREERERLAAAESDAAEVVATAETSLGDLPERRRLEDLRRDLVARDELATLVARGRDAAQEAATRVDEAAAAVQATAERRDAAAAALERVRVEQRAQALVPELRVGDPCPVCQQTVDAVPEATSPEVAGAEQTLAAAEQEQGTATREHSDARTHQARVDEKLARVEQDLRDVDDRLADGAAVGIEAPDLTAVDELLEQIARAEQAVESARRAERDVRRQRTEAEARHRELVEQESQAWRAFDAARDRLAVLRPPAFDRRDLAADWSALLRWAGEQRPGLVESAAAEWERMDAARKEHRQRWEELAGLCRAAGVDVRPPEDGTGAGAPPPAGALTEAVAVAQARAGDAVRRIEEELAETRRLREEHRTATERSQVAEALADHLKANRFEKWLLDEAVLALASGASDILGELTGGAYALSLDSRSGAFTVIDHANASQPRPARTLSGGETFLASLALALALADQVAELATGGTARLEALFLDEGFGTLDAETLDVVAAALDELGARGRMVGVVTHVRELAERLPVRFEVRKVGASATVERVEER